METKDFVLLMLIPIILISIVIYTDKGPIITGAATSQQEKKEQSNILGTYSIMPSFKAEFKYDLSHYAKIKQTLDNLFKCAENGQDVQSCVDDINRNDNSFKWELNCDKGAEKVLYDFAEFLQDCFDSEDNKCICTNKFEYSKEKIQQYGLDGRYNIGIEENTDSKRIEARLLEINDKAVNFDLMQAIETNGILISFPKSYTLTKYIIAYKNDKATINLIFKEPSDVIRGLGPLTEIIIYKNNNNPSKTKSIDFVRQEGDDLFYPLLGKILQKPSNLLPCQLKPKNIYKFCVTKNNYKIMAYDKLDGQVKERAVTIKFASYIPVLPPPLKNIEVYDRPKAEKSVLIKWDKSTFKDVAIYRIYYTESSDILEKTPTKDLRKNKVFMKEISPATIKTEKLNGNIIPADCEFDYQSKKCIFSTNSGDKTPIESDKLYYSNEGSYIYNLILPEDSKNYDFAVTVIDKNNNEIDNINKNQKLPIVKSKQYVDDLPINSKEITSSSKVYYIKDDKNFAFVYNYKISHKNIDDSDALDFDLYKVYYIKSSNLIPEQIIEIQKSLANKPLKEFTYFFEFKPNPVKPEPFKSPQIEIKDGEYYFFIIVSFDKNGNPKAELKPIDVGIEFPLRYSKA